MKGNELQIRLAENLKRLRKEKSLTQFALAEVANISEVTVRKIETCNQWPSENKIMQLANALDVDVCNLFMPVPYSIEIPDEIKNTLEMVIFETYKKFLDEKMNEILASSAN